MNGYFCQGFNPLLSFPNREKMHGGAVQAEVPGRHGSARDRDGAVLGESRRATTTSTRRRSRPRSSSCRRTCFAEDEGSLTNSGRWLQWHWPGGDAAGRGQAPTSGSWRSSICGCGRCTQKEGGAVPEPILNLHWPLRGSGRAAARGDRQGAQRLGARRRGRSDRPDQGRAARRASRSASFAAAARRRHDRVRLLDLFRLLHRGRQQHGAARHLRSGRRRRLSRNGRGPGRSTGASSTTAPRPTSRASRGMRAASCIEWNGEKWTGYDVPDIAPTAKPERGRPVHHEPGRRLAPVHPRA